MTGQRGLCAHLPSPCGDVGWLELAVHNVIGEASFCSGCRVTQRPTNGPSAENKSLWTVQPKVEHLHLTPPPKAQGSLWKGSR